MGNFILFIGTEANTILLMSPLESLTDWLSLVSFLRLVPPSIQSSKRFAINYHSSQIKVIRFHLLILRKLIRLSLHRKKMEMLLLIFGDTRDLLQPLHCLKV